MAAPGFDRPTCPFCSNFSVDSYGERDQYLLHQHVGLEHPENGESPFLTRESPGRENGYHGSWNNSRGHLHPPSNGMSSIKNRQGNLSPRASFSLESLTPDPSHSRSLRPDTIADEDYVDCPIDCGEAVHVNEIAYHMEMHDNETLALDELGRARYSREKSPAPFMERPLSAAPPDLEDVSRPNSVVSAPPEPEVGGRPREPSRSKRSRPQQNAVSLKGLFGTPNPRKARPGPKSDRSGPRRLGKSELGPYAFEERMPVWLYRQLEAGAKVVESKQIDSLGNEISVQKVANETAGVIPVLAHLCQQDRAISKAFLCHPSVNHVFKQTREGGFCGYRNIQMAVSFLQETGYPGHHHFPGSTPSVLRLQDLIEEAWDQGYNSSGRTETGGIRGTRKYIGTPEAQALFSSLGISCEANAFNESVVLQGAEKYVHHAVLEEVFRYFSSGVTDPMQKVYRTGLAPIYFQHPGHSLTIVGLEVRRSGRMNLLVFDPMFKTVPGVVRLIGSSFKAADPDRLLKAFRRGDSYLNKYESFEILKLTNPHRTDFSTSGFERNDTPLRGDGNDSGLPILPL